jgi:uncharacterized protein YkwD
VRFPRGPWAALAALLVLAFVTLAGVIFAAGARARDSGVYERRWLEQQLWLTISKVRAIHGLGSLRPNEELTAAAQQHTFEMLRDGYFLHRGATRSYARRLAAFYPRTHRRGWHVGEILAWGSPSLSAEEAVSLWLRSPRHRTALLSRWRDVGIAAMHSPGAPGFFGGLDATVITIDFGTR